MRSPFERFDEWLFKQRRKNPFFTFKSAIHESRCFRELVEQTTCPACKNKSALEVQKFERGPKGWEADIECSNCMFKGVISQLSTVFLELSSKGKAVKTSKTRSQP